MDRVYFYLSAGCNLRCRHCWIEPGHESTASIEGKGALPLELFRSILEQAIPLGLKGVKLTGGEPLLHPRLAEIIGIVRTAKMHLTIETNGVLVTPELAEMIASCREGFVAVSLDGATPEIHEWVRGVKGCFDDALRGVRYLVEAGLRPQIIMTIMRHNQDQVSEMVSLAESLGAGSLKFNIVQPTSRGEKMHRSGETLDVEELLELGRWIETEIVPKTSILIHFDYPVAFRSLGSLFGKNKTGSGTCGITGIIGVLSNGSYALCGIGETVPELVFGHAARDRLADVWNNNPVLVEIREGLPGRLKGVCGDCLLKARCRGSCIAQNYYSSKDLWAPYWFCVEAERRGLFPESRALPKGHSKRAV